MSNDFRTEIENKKAKYSRWSKVRNFGQSFEEDPKVKRAGKYISLREFTNKNAVDSNIYEVLAKYRGDLKMTQAEMQTHAVANADNLAEIHNLADAFKVQAQAKEAWATLPLEIRKEFGNNKTQFMINGAKWANKKISDFKAKEEQLKEQIEMQQQKEQGAINNG